MSSSKSTSTSSRRPDEFASVLALDEPLFLVGGQAVNLWVPGPIALLQAKIANSADLQQRGRQDERHVRILAKLMPAYLKDLLASINHGKIDERAMLKRLEHLLTVITTPNARNVLKRLQIDGPDFFAGIEVRSPSKLHSFPTLHLPRAFPLRSSSS
jgi:hypothetical protein